MADHKPQIAKKLKKLGSRLRELRIAAGYSNHEEFAFAAGINRTQYWGYEKGENITVATLLRITSFLKITMAELFEPIEQGK